MYIFILITTTIFFYFFIHYLQFERKFGHLRKTFECCHWSIIKRVPKLTKLENGIDMGLEISHMYKKYSIYCLFPVCKLLVYEGKLAELILNTNLDKTEEYSYHDAWLKNGILTSKYGKWKGQKKLLAPIFSIDKLQHHIKVFNEKAHTLCDKLDGELPNPAVDIYQYVILCTLDMILATAIGANINVQDNPSSSYMKSIRTICEVLYVRTFISNLLQFGYELSPYYKKEKQAAKILNDFSSDFIKERFKGISTSTTRTLLDIIVETQDISYEDIRGQLNTFIFAGHDTTGITISFALYALSKHPHIQEKVYQEILDVVGHDNDPTYEDLMKLPYMSMVLMEVSRLYPAVPCISRVITREIDFNGCTLPKGLASYISIYTIHRDADYFPDPEKFDPDRFSEENRKNRPTFAYMPFSIGARNCIGKKFAQLEMKTVIVNVLQRFEILPALPEYDVHVMTFVTLQSSNGIKIRIKER